MVAINAAIDLLVPSRTDSLTAASTAQNNAVTSPHPSPASFNYTYSQTPRPFTAASHPSRSTNTSSNTATSTAKSVQITPQSISFSRRPSSLFEQESQQLFAPPTAQPPDYIGASLPTDTSASGNVFYAATSSITAAIDAISGKQQAKGFPSH